MTRPALIALALASGVILVGCHHNRPAPATLVSDGRRVFRRAGCGSCHAVASAQTHGQPGPDFDTSEPLTRAQIRVELNLGEGGMPSFRHRLTPRQQQAVTEFVFHTLHQRR